MPMSTHVVDELSWNPALWAFWKIPAPREAPQLLVFANVSGGQPSDSGTQTSPCDVAGKTLNACCGVPICMGQTDQFPSLPAHETASSTNGRGAAIVCTLASGRLQWSEVYARSSSTSSAHKPAFHQ